EKYILGICELNSNLNNDTAVYGAHLTSHIWSAYCLKDKKNLQPKYMISEDPKKNDSEKIANSSKKVADDYDKLHKLYMSNAKDCNYSKLFTVSDNKLVLMRILDSNNPNENVQKNPNENVQKNLNENVQKNLNENVQKNPDENYQKNPNENYQKNLKENYQKNLNENDPVMIGIFDLETRKHYLPTSIKITIKVSQSAFMKNGDVIMIDLGTSSSAMSFKRSFNTKVFVTPNEKLLIYDKSRFGSGNITKWDLKTSLFEAHFFLSNVFEVHDVKLNYNESLLLVYTTKYTEKKDKKEKNVIVYLANNGMKLVT
ncbi:11945_t:CDS:2, partial [Gigaspora rosea]